MEEQKIVKVTNRHSGSVGYHLPDQNIRRVFSRGETKSVPLAELEQLQWVEGGDYILQNYLVVNDSESLEKLNMDDVEPEYFYTEEDVKKLLLEGTLDQLEDTLNFGNEGVKELVKSLAVTLEIPDIRKRDMISKQLGLDINKAIEINHVMAADVESAEDAGAGKVERKAKPITDTEAAPARKAATGFKTMK